VASADWTARDAAVTYPASVPLRLFTVSLAELFLELNPLPVKHIIHFVHHPLVHHVIGDTLLVRHFTADALARVPRSVLVLPRHGLTAVKRHYAQYS
jgi:hypothetical protein